MLDGTLTLTINTATLVALAVSAFRISNAITRLTTIQEQQEKRLERLEQQRGLS